MEGGHWCTSKSTLPPQIKSLCYRFNTRLIFLWLSWAHGGGLWFPIVLSLNRPHKNQMQRRVRTPLHLYYQISECEILPIETVLCSCISCSGLGDSILYHVAVWCHKIIQLQLYIVYILMEKYAFFNFGLKSCSNEFALQVPSNFNGDFFFSAIFRGISHF